MLMLPHVTLTLVELITTQVTQKIEEILSIGVAN